MSLVKIFFIAFLMGNLIGCGSEDSSSEDNGNTILPGDRENQEDDERDDGTQIDLSELKPNFIFSLQDIIEKKNRVKIIESGTTNNEICGRENVSYALSENFAIGYQSLSEDLGKEHLEKLAKISEVALDELSRLTKLNKKEDLKTGRWLICFQFGEDKDGEVVSDEAYLTLTTLDTDNKDFMSMYRLIKHEMYHLFQDSLLDGQGLYLIPQWFKEGTADYFSGSDFNYLNSIELEKLINTTELSPFNIEINSDQSSVESQLPEVDVKLYDFYDGSLRYLIQSGLSIEGITTITKNSAVNNSQPRFSNFYNQFENLESTNQLILPVPFSDLRDDPLVYKEYVIDSWLHDYETRAMYLDDIEKDVEFIAFFNIGSEFNSENIIAEGSINESQTEYTVLGSLTSNTYNVIVGKQNEIYGPIEIKFQSGSDRDVVFISANQ